MFVVMCDMMTEQTRRGHLGDRLNLTFYIVCIFISDPHLMIHSVAKYYQTKANPFPCISQDTGQVSQGMFVGWGGSLYQGMK